MLACMVASPSSVGQSGKACLARESEFSGRGEAQAEEGSQNGNMHHLRLSNEQDFLPVLEIMTILGLFGQIFKLTAPHNVSNVYSSMPPPKPILTPTAHGNKNFIITCPCAAWSPCAE